MEQEVVNNTESGDNSTNDFIAEVSQPTTPALDTATPAVNEPEPIYNVAEPEPATEQERQPGEPIFKKEGTTGPQPAAVQPPKRSDDYKRKVLKGLIKAEEFTTGRICGIVAGTDNFEQFKYQEDDIETLLVMLEPFEEWILEKCPAVIPLLLVYTGLKTDQIIRAAKLYKTRKENAAKKGSVPVADKVNAAANTQEQKARTRFAINKKGEYTHDRFGAYLKAGEPKELAHIDDLDKILEGNRLSVVKEAFNLTDEDLQGRGL